ncbi:hypothetical protein ACWD0D_33465 [Streptomyces griseoincarnatus]
MSDPKSVTWLRPEYKGREDELINLAAGAALVGVTRSTVSNWAKRHATFPKIVLLTGIGDRRVKYIPRDEFLCFAHAQMNKERTPARRPAARRPTTLLRSDEIAHSERQIARLTELEARQAKALARTQQALKKHRERLRQARQALAAEIAAVHHLEQTEGASGVDSATPGGGSIPE